MRVLEASGKTGALLFIVGLVLSVSEVLLRIYLLNERGPTEPVISMAVVFLAILLMLIALNPWKPLPTKKPYYDSPRLWVICWIVLVWVCALGIPYKLFHQQQLEPFVALPLFAILPIAIWEAERMR